MYFVAAFADLRQLQALVEREDQRCSDTDHDDGSLLMGLNEPVWIVVLSRRSGARDLISAPEATVGDVESALDVRLRDC